MKKILAIAVSALCVAAAQAAQIAWEIDGVTKPGSSDLATAGFGYLFDADTYGAKDISDAIDAGTIASMTHVGNVASISDSGYLYASKKSEEAYDPSTTYNFIAVVFDTDAIGEQGKYFITNPVSQKTKGSGTTTVALLAPSNIEWKSYGTPVPEPCSVALLALGLTAFGLKRKVA